MKSPELCITKFCRHKRGKKDRRCSKCKMRRWREANPDKALFAWIRDRAKRDQREFDLTLEWFRAFLLEQNYDRLEHHIDRISVARGYVMGNLQVLPISDNIAKGNRERGKQLQIL